MLLRHLSCKLFRANPFTTSYHFLYQAIPDTKLTIKKYADAKFEYLVRLFGQFLTTSSSLHYSTLFCPQLRWVSDQQCRFPYFITKLNMLRYLNLAIAMFSKFSQNIQQIKICFWRNAVKSMDLFKG